MLKNVIFDIGNVLANYREMNYYIDLGYDEKMALRLAEASMYSSDWAQVDKGVLDYQDCIDLFKKNDPGISQQLQDSLIEIKGLVTKRNSAIPWILDLKARGYKVYYLSNFSAPAFRDCKEALDFLPYCDGGILSFKEKVVKPDPEIYELLLNRYNLLANECVFIDDTLKNVEGAIKAGMQALQYIDQVDTQTALDELLAK